MDNEQIAQANPTEQTVSVAGSIDSATGISRPKEESKMTYRQSKTKVRYVWNRLQTTSESVNGEIITPHGILYASSWDYYGPHTTLEIVHDGYMHSRHYAKRYTARTIVTLARQFAAEICTGA